MLVSLFPLSVLATNVSDVGQEKLLVNTVPDEAIILSKTEEILYFVPQTEEQLLSSDLYEVKESTIVYQDYGGLASIGIQLRSESPLCLFESISGTWTAQTSDLSYNYSNAPIYASALVPFPLYNSPTFECPHQFEIGEVVNVYWNYHINIVRGSILNGGQISGSNKCTIVR